MWSGEVRTAFILEEEGRLAQGESETSEEEGRDTMVQDEVLPPHVDS